MFSPCFIRRNCFCSYQLTCVPVLGMIPLLIFEQFLQLLDPPPMAVIPKTLARQPFPFEMFQKGPYRRNDLAERN